MNERIVLRFCDWNYNYHLYEAPAGLLVEFRRRFKSDGFKAAWTWWNGQVDFTETCSKPVSRVTSIKYDSVYLDFHNQDGSIEEWPLVME